MCSPRNHGGCGIHNLKDQNRAFLSKLAFSLIHEPLKLWVQVLQSKYNWGLKTNYEFKTKIASHTWRSIAQVWPDLQLNLSWDIRIGHHIRFWQDNWVAEMGPLQFLTYADVAQAELSKTLASYVDPHGRWNPHAPNINQRIVTTNPPSHMSENDSCYWNLSSNGLISVASVYKAIRGIDTEASCKHWDWFWKWPGIQRIRVF